MNKSLTVFCAGAALFVAGAANAQWNSWGGMPGTGAATSGMTPWGSMPGAGNSPMMMPWGQARPQPQYYQQPRSMNMMPWGGTPAPAYSRPAQPQQPFGNMMPWGGNSAPAYSPPTQPQQPFGNMMPWGNMQQPQARQQPQAQSFMMPGMDQGIRSMMQPGKIMAEEATPGMYMKPTWQ